MEEGREMCKNYYERLQEIWSVIGADVAVCNRILLEIEERCLTVYSSAVEEAELWQKELEESIGSAREEMRHIRMLIGEPPAEFEFPEEASLQEQEILVKEEIDLLRNKLELCKAKFGEVQNQIAELEEYLLDSAEKTKMEEDYRQEYLEDLKGHLASLQELKESRILQTINSVGGIKYLCSVMAFSHEAILGDIHSDLCSDESPSGNALHPTVQNDLQEALRNLEEEKKERVQRMSDLGASILALCHLMDRMPPKEQDDVTACVGASVSGNFQMGMLSDENLEKARAEVEKLEEEQAVRVEELASRKLTKIKEIYEAAHMEPQLETAVKLTAEMRAGVVAAADVLAMLEEEISRASEAKVSRAEILQMLDRWQRSSAEVLWLEKFEQDEKRYASKGAFKDLDRAEKARKEHKKLPGLVKTLITKIQEWETSRNETFLYDGENLINTVEQEEDMRLNREEERKRILEHLKEEKRRQLEDSVKFGPPTRTNPARRPPPATAPKHPSTAASNAPHTPAPAGAEKRGMAHGSTMVSPSPNAKDRRLSMGGMGGTPRNGNPHTNSSNKPIIAAPPNVVVLSREGKEHSTPKSPLSPRPVNQGS